MRHIFLKYLIFQKYFSSINLYSMVGKNPKISLLKRPLYLVRFNYTAKNKRLHVFALQTIGKYPVSLKIVQKDVNITHLKSP